MKIDFKFINIKTCWECPFLKFEMPFDKSMQGYACGRGVFSLSNDDFGFYNQFFENYKNEIHPECPLKKTKRIKK